MEVNLQIPDEIARRVIDAGGDPSRRVLEAFALEELRAGLFQDYAIEDFDLRPNGRR